MSGILGNQSIFLFFGFRNNYAYFFAVFKNSNSVFNADQNNNFIYCIFILENYYFIILFYQICLKINYSFLQYYSELLPGNRMIYFFSP